MRKYGDDSRYSSLDVMCPDCGSWHSIYTKCPSCGHNTKWTDYVERSRIHDIYTHQDYEYLNPGRSICETCGSVYNNYKYEKCPYCYGTYSSRKYNKYSNKQSNKPEFKHVSLNAVCPNCHRVYEKKLYRSCPYCNKSKPSYKPKSDYNNNESMMIICPNCGKYYHKNRYWSCPYCNGSKNKSTYKFRKYIVQCPNCNNKYNSKFNDECPFCKGKKSKSNSNSVDDWIFAGCCLGIILIFILWVLITSV